VIIPSIILSDTEMCRSVEDHLKIKGIFVPVESIEKNYSGPGGWKVTLTEPECEPRPLDDQPQPAAATLEEPI